jgi:hypothetical protein
LSLSLTEYALFINNKKMKRILSTLIATIFLIACGKETCVYSPECEPFGENSSQSGFTVVTYNAENSSAFVGGIYDTRNNASAPAGNDWAPTLISSGKVQNPADWTVKNLGRVFGIAIDDNSNIYLASTGVYTQYSTLAPYKNTNPGRIYKATAPSYTISTLVDLPSITYAGGTGSLNGVGNIAYDKVNKQLFATNLDNGKIYRISMAGVIQPDVYDPWTVDVASPDITVQDERIWGIGVNYENGKVKLYFARITNPVTTTSNRNLYSITLNPDGSLPTSTVPTLEIANLPGTMAAITDIEFSGDTKKILLAERGEPHNAISFSYNKIGSSWVSNTQYFVGGLTGKNSAGGVDFAYKSDEKGNVKDCDDFIWNSGNYLDPVGIFSPTAIPTNKVYGLQGIKYTGNTLAGSRSTDLYIDYNPPVYLYEAKGNMGDVDVIDANACFCISKK